MRFRINSAALELQKEGEPAAKEPAGERESDR
jgi:hypothetical protein